MNTQLEDALELKISLTKKAIEKLIILGEDKHCSKEIVTEQLKKLHTSL